VSRIFLAGPGVSLNHLYLPAKLAFRVTQGWPMSSSGTAQRLPPPASETGGARVLVVGGPRMPLSAVHRHVQHAPCSM